MRSANSDDLDIREIEDADVSSLIALWQTSGLTRPWNDPEADIDQARGNTHSKILVGLLQGEIVASIMVGEDGHRGWVYYLAVDPRHKQHGLGRCMMDAAELWLRGRGVPKLNLMIRNDNAAATGFYERIGYSRSDVVCYQKTLN